ncbi:MAG: hypothetical protein AVDCRST_MAG66-2701, partial [uncultured Pseudonocardia sp.]
PAGRGRAPRHSVARRPRRRHRRRRDRAAGRARGRHRRVGVLGARLLRGDQPRRPAAHRGRAPLAAVDVLARVRPVPRARRPAAGGAGAGDRGGAGGGLGGVHGAAAAGGV